MLCVKFTKIRVGVHMRNKFLVLFIFLFEIACCQAKVALTANPKKLIPNAVEIGTGDLFVFPFGVIYKATLWAEKKPWSFNQKFALSIRYNRNISKEDFLDTTIKEMRRYYKLSKADETNYRTQLSRVYPSVKSGDRITAVFTPKEGVKFYYNGSFRGEIKGGSFAHKFINIWLHPNAYYGDLRNDLLGK